MSSPAIARIAAAAAPAAREVRLPTYLGGVLFALYLLYHLAPFHWPQLEDWQTEESFRRWSGLALLLYLSVQWWLTLARITPRLGRTRAPLLKVHRWVGALTPLAFLAHSSSLGYGYLGVLSVTFLANFLLGLLNVRTLKAGHPRLYVAWYVVHAGASVLITALALLHVWVVFYYK